MAPPRRRLCQGTASGDGLLARAPVVAGLARLLGMFGHGGRLAALALASGSRSGSARPGNGDGRGLSHVAQHLVAHEVVGLDACAQLLGLLGEAPLQLAVAVLAGEELLEAAVGGLGFKDERVLALVGQLRVEAVQRPVAGQIGRASCRERV